MNENKSSIMLRLLVGAVVVFIGVGILLDNFGIMQFWDLFSTWWPSLLILFGLAQIISSPKQYLSALIIIAVGSIFLVDALGFLPVSAWAVVFPAILIIVGFRVIIGSAGSKLQEKSQSDYVNNVAVFGASDVVNSSASFKGGMITAIFGGAKVDLREAKLFEGQGGIDLNVAFGGVDIIVPKDCEIKVNAIPLFGGIGNKTVQVSCKGGLFKVKGLVLFGGVEIKNDVES